MLFLTLDVLRTFLRINGLTKFPLHFWLTPSPNQSRPCRFVRLASLSSFLLFPTCNKTWYCIKNDCNKTSQPLTFDYFLHFSYRCHFKNNDHWGGETTQWLRGLAEFAEDASHPRNGSQPLVIQVPGDLMQNFHTHELKIK